MSKKSKYKLATSEELILLNDRQNQTVVAAMRHKVNTADTGWLSAY